MTLWQVVVALLDVYLIVSLGPWIVLQACSSMLGRPGQTPDDEGKRLRALEEALGKQARRWPSLPRPGRYEAHDRAAQASLNELNAALGDANSVWPHVAAYAPMSARLTEVLTLHCWRPARSAWLALRDLRTLRRHLGRAQAAWQALSAAQEVVRLIPALVRGELNEARAEVDRLKAVVEAEREAGTQGLEPTVDHLKALGLRTETALDMLAAAGADISQVVDQADAMLASLRPEIRRLDEDISQAVEGRARARDLIERMESGVRLAQERWEGLKARGAREPEVARAVANLAALVDGPKGLLQERTLASYRQIGDGGRGYDDGFAGVMGAMDRLQELIEISKAAVEGDVQAVEDVQLLCDRVTQQDAALEPDVSLGLVTRATELYVEAERQRDLGTKAGYELALELVQTAQQRLAEAYEAVKQLPEQARTLREHIALLSADGLGDLAARLHLAREQLAGLPRHWTTDWANVAKSAESDLDQARRSLEQVPPDLRTDQRLLQSALGSALEILVAGLSHLEQAEEAVARLEGERARIAGLQAQLQAETDTLTGHVLPELSRSSALMVPELRERLERVQESVLRGISALENSAQVNYDQAVSEWLPAAQRSLQEIRDEHENNLAYYRNLLADAVRRIDKAWARVSRMAPQDRPGPEEDAQQLAVDLDAWRAEAEKHLAEPLALRESVRRAPLLEQRIESVYREVTEGRRALEDLDRVYRREVLAVTSLRNAIDDHQTHSAWPKLAWSLDDANQAWEHTETLEEGSRRAATLKAAYNQLQQAVAAAGDAKELYERAEREMAGALGRLDEERASVELRWRRAERWAAELREQGVSADLVELEDAMGRARRELDAAEAAVDFEEALRHLREAGNALSRVLGM